MLHEDYLMRQLLAFFQALANSRSNALTKKDMIGQAETLESLVGETSGLGSDMLLKLSPESISTILRSTGVDPQITEFMAHSLLQAGKYRQATGDEEVGKLREQQAIAISKEFGFDLDVNLEDFLEANKPTQD